MSTPRAMIGRREALGALGLAGLALTSRPIRARAQDQSVSAGLTRDPSAQVVARMFQECMKTCSDCMNVCNETAQHCFDQIQVGKLEHANTLHHTVDCQEFCGVSAKLIGRRSPLMNIMCEACAKACDECAEACEKLSSDSQMTACAQECRQCARSCREVLKHLGAH